MVSEYISFLDWLFALLYLLCIFLIARIIYFRLSATKNPIYRYFIPGLFAKIGGAVGLCMIYVYYYEGGGDTTNYHYSACVLLKLMFHSYADFLDVLLSPLSAKTGSYFTSETGYPMYLRDSNAFMVIRLIVPIEFVGFGSYLVVSILMGVISFTGVWKLYTVFCDCYPALYKHFAVTVLFMPSVLFWGSGILKDSWTLAAAGWYTYSFYRIFIKGDRIFFSLITLFISVFILVTIKPYIFVGLLPGSILWLVWTRLSKIKNKTLKIIAAPVILTFGISIGVGIWMLTSSNLGKYNSIDSMIEKASVSYEDLKQDHYKGNSFDMGNYEPTLPGMLSKFPIATVTGLFRPFLWETNNIVMIMSGLENLIILGFAIFVLLRKPLTTAKELFSNPLVLFCLIFAIFFAFSVAISTSNFGALVRLRIPMIPFFLSGLIVAEHISSIRKKTIQGASGNFYQPVNRR